MARDRRWGKAGQGLERELVPVPQIDYWQANGGVTYRDPDGREVVFASWIYRPPSGSR